MCTESMSKIGLLVIRRRLGLGAATLGSDLADKVGEFGVLADGKAIPGISGAELARAG